jgi:hypothetical protein
MAYDNGENIFAKKINPLNGNEIWVKQVTAGSAVRSHAQLSADNKRGGVLIVWRELISEKYYLYALFLDPDGNPGWEDYLMVSVFTPSFGVKLFTGPEKACVILNTPAFDREGAFVGNFVVVREIASEIGETKLPPAPATILKEEGTHFDAVQDEEYIAVCLVDNNDDLYVRYIAAKGGTEKWNAIVDEGGSVGFPKIAVDGNGNCFVVWVDNRSGNADIYIQKLYDGKTLWAEGGEVVIDAAGFQGYFATDNGSVKASDSPMAYDDGKIYVAWNDGRSDPSFGSDTDISYTSNLDVFVQGIDAETGERLMNIDVPVGSALGAQFNPEVSALSPMFVAWSDGRNGSAWQTFAQKVENIPTLITGVTAADPHSVVNGSGFGADTTQIQNPNFAAGSNFNKVTVDGIGRDVISWSRNAVTIDYPFGALTPGSHIYKVTAYGESDEFTQDVVRSDTNFTFKEVTFGGAPYRRRDYVTASSDFEGKIVSKNVNQNKININSVIIDVDGVETDVTSDFSSATDTLNTTVSFPDPGTKNVKVAATDIYGQEGSATYTVQVLTGLEVAEVAVSEAVIEGAGVGAAATQAVTLAFNVSQPASLNIIVYTPAGQPIKLVKQVTTGYNEVALDRQIFNSGNGIYIIDIYDENNVKKAQTWATVLAP